MNENIKSYLVEACAGYTKSLTQVDEFLTQQASQLAEAKQHRAAMVVKIEELKELIGEDDAVVESLDPENSDTKEEQDVTTTD
tara:strand:+ start:402 stop:650 length:249 start_codon:yes stop_codon:yes gene_type:complete